MTIVACIGDTHGLHRLVPDVGSGDIFIHAGDWSRFGRDGELDEFNEWLGTLPFQHRVVIAGNHDREAYCAERIAVKRRFTNAIYLQDETVELAGLKIYGSPWTPEFLNWYFMLPRNSPAAARVWAKVPSTTDILVTHGCAFGTLDMQQGVPIGCPYLAEAAARVNPVLHVCGHIHHNRGVKYNYATDHAVANCSSWQGERNVLAPFTFTIENGKIHEVQDS